MWSCKRNVCFGGGNEEKKYCFWWIWESVWWPHILHRLYSIIVDIEVIVHNIRSQFTLYIVIASFQMTEYRDVGNIASWYIYVKMQNGGHWMFYK